MTTTTTTVAELECALRRLQKDAEREVSAAILHASQCPDDAQGSAMTLAIVIDPAAYEARTQSCPHCNWTREVYYRKNDELVRR